MSRLASDLRLAVRGLRRKPGFAASVVLILGLGIGMTVAMLSVYDSVLARPLPVLAQDRVVALRVLDRSGVDECFLNRELPDIRRNSRTVGEYASFTHWGAFPLPLTDGDRPLVLPQTAVSGNFFGLLGARPALGRLLRPEDDIEGAAHVMVLSFRTWRQLFAGDSGIIGHRLTDPIRQWSYTVIGVAPAGLDYPPEVGAWIPVVPMSNMFCMNVLGRLAPDATGEQARGEFLVTMQRVDASRRVPITPVSAQVRGFTDEVLGDTRAVLVALTAAVALLLLITCANVGNLVLLRAAGRTREFAVRRSLGATGGAIVRQVLTESAVLAVAGGTAGLAVAAALLRALVAFAPPQLPRVDGVALAGAPVAIACAVTVIALALFAVAPAVGAARARLGTPLRVDARSGSQTRSRRRVRYLLVATQVALAVVTLVGAGLLVRSLDRLQHQDLGYARDRLAMLSLTFPATDPRYNTRAKWRAMMDDVYGRVRHVPGVDALTPVLIPPFLGPNVWEVWFDVEGRQPADSAEIPHVAVESGGSEFFRTMGIRILRGRGFTEEDRAESPKVLVVSESVARRYWPGEDAIGKRIHGRSDSTWRTVVGVAGETHFRSLREAVPMVYYPASQFESQGFFAVRTSAELGAVLPAMRRVIHEVYPDVVLWRPQTMDQYLAGPLAQPRLGALLLSGLGLSALLLAVVGLYGVMAAAVRDEMRDFGVRMALGATPGRVRRDVVGRALGVTTVGAVLGLAAALGATRLLRTILYEVTPTDPLTLAAVIVLLVAGALVAAYLPARRATRIDPTEAFRSCG